MRLVSNKAVRRIGLLLATKWLAGTVRGRRRTRSPVKPILGAAAAGAAAAYLFDPQQGRRRRAVGRDRTLAAVRGIGRGAAGAGRGIGARSYGLTQRMLHRGREDTSPNDPTIKHIIESEVLHGAHYDASRVNVNVEDGIVVLRGILDSPEQINEVLTASEKIEGVRGVQNLMHLPNTPPPKDAEVRQVRVSAPNVIN